MDYQTPIENIQEVIDLLKQKEILFIKSKSGKTFFVAKKDKVLCQNKSSSYRLSFKEFISLYYEAKFFIFNGDEESFIDPNKDEEYYNWSPLKK